jgi:hypothetical protein
MRRPRPLAGPWHNVAHRDPLKHKRCVACRFDRRRWAAEDLVKRLVPGSDAAKAAAAANLVELDDAGIIRLDRGQP